MKKYKVRAIQSIEHIYYIKAECSFEAEEKAEDMCKKLLANLVIEDYKIIESQ